MKYQMGLACSDVHADEEFIAGSIINDNILIISPNHGQPIAYPRKNLPALITRNKMIGIAKDSFQEDSRGLIVNTNAQLTLKRIITESKDLSEYAIKGQSIDVKKLMLKKQFKVNLEDMKTSDLTKKPKRV